MEILFYSTARRNENVKELTSALMPNNLSFFKGEVNNLIDAVYNYDPDILFISNNLDLENTIEILKSIFIIKPQIEIVFCIKKPDPSFIIKLMRTGIREVVESFDLADIKPVIDRIGIRNEDLIKPSSQRSSKIVAFMSAKGGDGATCVAANIAATISQDSKVRVIVLDLSLPFGDIEMFMTNEKRKYDLADFSNEIERLDGPLLDSMVEHLNENLHLIPSPISVDRIINIDPDCISRLIDIVSRYYNFILIDIGAGIDPISIQALGKVDEMIIVSTMNIPSFKRSTQVISYWNDLGFDMSKLHLVINRYLKNSADVKISDFEKIINKKIDQILPEDKNGVQQSLLKGIPLINLYPKSPFSKAIKDWSAIWLGDKKKKTIWHRLKIK